MTAFRGARVQDPERSVRRQPHVLPCLLGHAELGRPSVRAEQEPQRAHRPAAADACQRALGDQGGARGRHRRGGGPQGRHHGRHAVRSAQGHHPGEDGVSGARDLGGRGAEDQGRPGEDGPRPAAAREGGSLVSRAYGPGIGADHHFRHGRAAPRDHRRPHEARVQGRGQRRQAAGRLPRDHPRHRRVRGQVRAPVRRPRPVRPRLAQARAAACRAKATSSSMASSAARYRASSSPPSTRAFKRPCRPA